MEKLMTEAEQKRELLYGRIRDKYEALTGAGTKKTRALEEIRVLEGVSNQTIYKALRSA